MRGSTRSEDSHLHGIRAGVRVCACAQPSAESKRVFITDVKGTFLGMSESEEASKRR